MSDRVGQRLGNYRLLRLLGRGGQASVYLGEHLYLKSQAAIKVLHTVLNEEEQMRFLQEAQTLVRLDHPHIVRVLDFALQDGMPFFVMEYAPHGTLRQRHPKGTRLSLDVIIPYVQQVASVLQYTHDQGLVHRDVKPENLVLNSRDEVLLSDFGLVMQTLQVYSSEATEPMEQPLVGTKLYLAPEQLRGKAEPASDQYALGVVVYEWLCGKPPFQGQFLEVAVQHVSAAPPSLCEQVPDISPAIEAVVLQALAKEPEQRFLSVQDFATALEQAYLQPGTRKGPAAQTRNPVPLHFERVEHNPEIPQTLSSHQELPKGTVTMLFTDMEGSTHLLQQLGDSYASVLAECRQLLRSAFQEWNGHEVDTQGDAFFVVFGRASDAVSAVVDAQRALAGHLWPEGAAVRVRMGLHTGEPALTQEGYVGMDVHRAARIMSAGHGGQVLLPQATSTLVEHDLQEEVSLRDLGERRLKDLGRPQRLFQLVVADLPSDFPPLKTLDARPNNLPIQPTPFIGREQELTTVKDLLLLEDVRLLTLTGPGGTGKTRLGLQVAADLSDCFVDGVFFVALAPVSDPALVIPTIAETLGIRQVTGLAPIVHAKEALHQKQMLLLLDNFEQVISAAAQVADLLAACPKLKVLVTSREVLHVRAEHEFAVPPLELPDPKHLPDLATLSHYAAVALFLQRARAVKPDFQMTNANARAIAEICARLDGLPLAIELAAARMKLLTPQALLARLSQRLQILTSTTRDVPTRQQTLRNTIAWSYQLLNSDEQRLFRRLSVFVGGCTLEAIEAVYAALGDSNEAASNLDGVASLMDKSLLQQNEQEDGETRFVMLETIREFGLEALTERGETEVVRRAHANYYLALADETEPKLTSAEQVRVLGQLEREHDNLRTAFRWFTELAEVEQAWQSSELALRLGEALWRFWQVRGHMSEGRRWLEQALVKSERAAPSIRAKALIVAANMALSQGDNRRASLLEENFVIARRVGDQRDIAMSLYNLACVAIAQRDFVYAYANYKESLGIYTMLDDKDNISLCLEGLGEVVTLQGEHIWAAQLWGAAEALRDAMGTPILPIYRSDYDRSVAAARAKLGEQAFATAWAEGRSMAPEQALAAKGPVTIATDVPVTQTTPLLEDA